MPEHCSIDRPRQRIPAARPSRHWHGWALVFSLALVLGACESVPFIGGGDGDGDAAEAKAPAESADMKSEPAVGSVTVIVPESQSEPPIPDAPSEQPASSAVAALPAEPYINDDPGQLIGMGPASVDAFLGAPELIRRESPASLWQYRAEGCVLDVVFYQETVGDRVTYLEAREDGTKKIPPRTCLNKLLRARLNAPAG